MKGENTNEKENSNQINRNHLGFIHASSRTASQCILGSTTYSYDYDNAGNIISSSTATGNHTYTYGDSDWGDLLTAFDGQTIEYDAGGNPTAYYNGTNWNFTWEKGRQLKRATSGSTVIDYEYDLSNGMRMKKTVGDTEYQYYYAGDKLIRMTIGDATVMDFFYDHTGQPYAVKYNGTVLLLYSEPAG